MKPRPISMPRTASRPFCRRRRRKTERTMSSVKASNSAGKSWKVAWPIWKCVAWCRQLDRQTAKGMLQAKVEDYMSHDVRSIHRAATIKEAGLLLQKYKVGSLIVDDGSRYIGIVTDSDLSRKAVAKGLDPNTTTVTTCMSKALVTIEEDELLSEAMGVMKKQGSAICPSRPTARSSACCPSPTSFAP